MSVLLYPRFINESPLLIEYMGLCSLLGIADVIIKPLGYESCLLITCVVSFYVR